MKARSQQQADSPALHLPSHPGEASRFDVLRDPGDYRPAVACNDGRAEAALQGFRTEDEPADAAADGERGPAAAHREVTMISVMATSWWLVEDSLRTR